MNAQDPVDADRGEEEWGLVLDTEKGRLQVAAISSSGLSHKKLEPHFEVPVGRVYEHLRSL